MRVLGLLAALGATSCMVGDIESDLGITPDVTHSTVKWWATSHPSSPLQRQSDLALGAPTGEPNTVEVLDDGAHQYQSVEGFGAALTDASAAILHYELDGDESDGALRDLMGPNRGIGLNLLRLPIAASDSTWNGRYSYDDNGPDWSLNNFSVGHDDQYIVPELQHILNDINPDTKIIASPWSPPAWMKMDTTTMIGGWMPWSNHDVYSRYIVNFVRQYWFRHIPIDYLTPQNEPGQPADYPSMTMTPQAEQDFLAHLRPALDQAHFNWVKILGFDHNWGDTYPVDLLSDPATRGRLDGIAFHCYGGDHSSAMTDLHNTIVNQWNDNKEFFLDECDRSETSGGANHVDIEGIQRLIRAMRNWSRSYMAWQAVLHPDGTPNQGHGCMGDNWHCVGVLSVDPTQPHGSRVSYNWDYAYLGHASKFVPRGSKVIGSGPPGHPEILTVGTIETVAFKTPSGGLVLVGYNTDTIAHNLQVMWHGQAFTASVPARSAVTFTW
jgi:glucosylceramidase